MVDQVSQIVADWNRERPDLDTGSVEVIARILRSAQLLQSRLDGVAAAHGLSHKGDLDALTALRRGGEPYESTPSELARSLQLTSGGMTNRLDRLESRGLVERRPDPGDRRGVVVRLTRVGVDLVDSAFVANLEAQEALLAGMADADRSTLAAHLATLLVALGDVAPRH